MADEYYKTAESVNEYIELAKDVHGKSLIKKLTHYIPFGSSILELGSGPGTDWNILNGFYSAIGSDSSDVFLEHLRKENPKGNFIELDASSIVTDDCFDGIYSNKVLHHLTDDQLEKSIERQSQVLNHKGIICHSFWKGEGDEVFKGLFVNYHERAGLTKVFGELFEILLCEEYEEFDESDSILLIARKR